jgi:hypothetical protein
VTLSRPAVGIVSAGIVLAGTDLGGAQRRLAALFTALSAEITGRFTGMLALAGPEMPETQPARQELVRRVIALDPVYLLRKRGREAQMAVVCSPPTPGDVARHHRRGRRSFNFNGNGKCP